MSSVPIGGVSATGDPLSDSIPYKDTAQTAHAMIKMAKAAQVQVAIREWVQDFVKTVRPKAYASEAAAFFYWMCDPANWRYVRDSRIVEMVRSPRRSLAIRSGDCDDQATFLLAACLHLGFRCRVVTVGFKPRALTIRPSFTHVFITIQDVKSGRWAVVDPVAASKTEDMLRRVKQVRFYDVEAR